MEELLTAKELSTFLKVKPITIYSWLHRGINIPCIRIGGTLRFSRSSIERWLKDKENERKKKNFEI